ncbi:MAG TPA: VWA domain-containing protein [Longimicrobiales bacterium]|nr:VWA domain-containing protein [Longimicrobiales bacterium]
MTWPPSGAWLLALLLPAAVAGVDLARRRRLARLGAALGLPGLERAERPRSALVVAATLLGVLSVLAPRQGEPSSPAATAGGLRGGGAGAEGGVPDLVLVADVSLSMAAGDVRPDRWSAARRAALRLALGREDRRVGLVAFAAYAYVLVPPTRDLGLVALHLDGLDPGAVTAQGSDLAAGLEAALEVLASGDAAGDGGAVVLLSDGEGFQEDAALAAALERAVSGGVVVHAVSVGTEEGAGVPGAEFQGGVTRARLDVLRRIAAGTGGSVVDAADGAGLAALADGGGGAAAPGASRGPGRPSPWPPLFALLALAALLAEDAVGRLAARAAR